MKEQIITILSQEIAAGSLSKLILSRSTDRQILKTVAKPYTARGEAYIQFETFTADGKALHKNIPASQASEYAADKLLSFYRQCNIICSGGNCEIRISKSGKIQIFNHISGHERIAAAEHNKQKNTILKDGEIYPFLCALGISDKNGRIYDKKRAKYRQINRFLEIIDDVYPLLPGRGVLTICDLCCGKSYLTFAAYHYFTAVKNRSVILYGIDRKADVIEFCAKTAQALGADGLNFQCGDVSTFSCESADLVLSLHACDIATDIVLANAVRMNARVILSTPCCHHEMMRQISCEPLSFITGHSLLKQKLCDAATDALRALRLEAEGYRVTTIELVDPDETPKNILLRALRSPISSEKRAQLIAEYQNNCSFLGVSPYLDKLLSNDDPDNHK